MKSSTPPVSRSLIGWPIFWLIATTLEPPEAIPRCSTGFYRVFFFAIWISFFVAIYFYGLFWSYWFRISKWRGLPSCTGFQERESRFLFGNGFCFTEFYRVVAGGRTASQSSARITKKMIKSREKKPREKEHPERRTKQKKKKTGKDKKKREREREKKMAAAARALSRSLPNLCCWCWQMIVGHAAIKTKSGLPPTARNKNIFKTIFLSTRRRSFS